MGKSEQQRQKKLAKKRTKELRGRRELARRNQAMTSIAGKMQWASRYPVHACYVSDENDGTSGMRSVFFARKIKEGQLVFVFVLVDLHCLGVKDAGWRFCTPSQFDEFLEQHSRNQPFMSRDPSYAKKLIDDAIGYATSIGFSPHPDYLRVAPIWGDIDASQCHEAFTFGLDGQPSYFAGPFDDEVKQRLIYSRLCETVGEGNFHFTVTASSASMESLNFLGGDVEWEGDEEFEDEDEDDADNLVFDRVALPPTNSN